MNLFRNLRKVTCSESIHIQWEWCKVIGKLNTLIKIIPICSLLRHPFLWPHFPSGHSESEAEMNFPWFIPFWFPYTGSILLFSKPSTAFILLLYFFFNWTCWTSLRSGCKWHVFCGFYLRPNPSRNSSCIVGSKHFVHMVKLFDQSLLTKLATHSPHPLKAHGLLPTACSELPTSTHSPVCL